MGFKGSPLHYEFGVTKFNARYTGLIFRIEGSEVFPNVGMNDPVGIEV